ncbi:riboflavin kinase [Patescibacteria group bacterium]
MKRLYTLEGIVIKGDGLGVKYGYPTANIDCKRIPTALKDGIYAARIFIAQKKHNGLLIMGDKNRIHPGQIKVELYVLDFEGNLYKQKLIAEIVEKIRPFKKFGSTRELITQIEEDCQRARLLLE